MIKKMRKVMLVRRYTLAFGLVCLFALLCLCLIANAQLLDSEGLMIYTGDPVERLGIKIGSWGSGKAEESTQVSFMGTRSLKVTSRGLYDGARLDFSTPLPLGTYWDNPNAYLQLIARFRTSEESGYGGYTSSSSTLTQGKPVRRVRVVLLINGKYLEGQVPLSGCKVGEDGWVRVSYPLKIIKGEHEIAEPKLERLIITGDGTEPFYVGEIRIINDNKPIQAYAGEDQFVAAKDDVMFRANVDPGAAVVRYSWDFDASDGIQEDAVGEVVYHKYRKPGEYTVTLTVSDIFGLKKPATSTLKVTVYE